jgi:hypothetical protein
MRAMIPPIVTQIAAQTTQAQHGSVSGTYERTFDVHAGPASRHDHMVMTAAYENGDLVAVHIVNDSIGGRDATAAQRSQTISQYERPKPTDVFRAPWDARYLGEYTYRVADATTIAFASTINDTAHGTGTFTVDARHNVVSYQYTMSANWSYVERSTITGERAEVFPGYWATTHEVQQYAGHYHAIAGGATTDILQSAFHRFPSAGDAEKAVNSE